MYLGDSHTKYVIRPSNSPARYNEIHSQKDGNSRNLLANEIYANRSHISTTRGLIMGASYVKRADGIRSHESLKG